MSSLCKDFHGVCAIANPDYHVEFCLLTCCSQPCLTHSRPTYAAASDLPVPKQQLAQQTVRFKAFEGACCWRHTGLQKLRSTACILKTFQARVHNLCNNYKAAVNAPVQHLKIAIHVVIGIQLAKGLQQVACFRPGLQQPRRCLYAQNTSVQALLNCF